MNSNLVTWTARVAHCVEAGFMLGVFGVVIILENLFVRMSSPLPNDSPFIPYLVRNGWRISERAHAFVQVNHSDILRELVGIIFSPLESELGLLPKGR